MATENSATAGVPKEVTKEEAAQAIAEANARKAANAKDLVAALAADITVSLVGEGNIWSNLGKLGETYGLAGNPDKTQSFVEYVAKNHRVITKDIPKNVASTFRAWMDPDFTKSGKERVSRTRSAMIGGSCLVWYERKARELFLNTDGATGFNRLMISLLKTCRKAREDMGAKGFPKGWNGCPDFDLSEAVRKSIDTEQRTQVNTNARRAAEKQAAEEKAAADKAAGAAAAAQLVGGNGTAAGVPEIGGENEPTQGAGAATATVTPKWTGHMVNLRSGIDGLGKLVPDSHRKELEACLRAMRDQAMETERLFVLADKAAVAAATATAAAGVKAPESPKPVKPGTSPVSNVGAPAGVPGIPAIAA